MTEEAAKLLFFSGVIAWVVLAIIFLRPHGVGSGGNG